MAVEKAKRKSAEDVRGELKAAREKRAKKAETIAAYDAKYKADAAARREKLAAEAKSGEKPAEGEQKPA